MTDTDTTEKFVDNFYAFDFVVYLVEDGDREAEMKSISTSHILR